MTTTQIENSQPNPETELGGCTSWEDYANGDTAIPFGAVEAEQCGQEADAGSDGCGGVWPFCGCAPCVVCDGRATMRDEDNESRCDEHMPSGGFQADTWAEYWGEK